MVKCFAVIMLVSYSGALACQTVCICQADHSSSVAAMLDMGDGPHGGHISEGDTGAPHQTNESQGTVDFYANLLLAIRGFRNADLVRASAIVGDLPAGCGEASAGTRYIEMANRTGGAFESILGFRVKAPRLQPSQIVG